MQHCHTCGGVDGKELRPVVTAVYGDVAVGGVRVEGDRAGFEGGVVDGVVVGEGYAAHGADAERLLSHVRLELQQGVVGNEREIDSVRGGDNVLGISL